MIYQTYQHNVALAKAEIQRLSKAINQNSLARLAVILGGGALLFYSFQQNSIGLVLGLTLFIVLLFAFLVNRQSKLEKQREGQQAFLRVNENELELAKHRKTIYSEGGTFEDGKHPYTSDLDIFGPFSLFTLLNRCATGMGVLQLADWLRKAASKGEILERQSAAKEIANDLEWSQRFQSKLIFNLGQEWEAKAFLQKYFIDSALQFGNAFMRLYVTVAPFILLAGVFYSVFVQPIWGLVIGLALIHLFWTLGMAGRVGLFSSKIDKVGQVLMAYAEGIACIEGRSFKAAKLKAAQEKLLIDDTKLSTAFKELATLINHLDARNNMLMGALLNMLFLWDFKYVMKIVQWKEKYQGQVLIAFDVVSEFEAINSLAILQRNHPDWATPVLLDNPLTDIISTKDINHPLISTNTAVANDYNSEKHAIALITGSNMAGKSTFLRTIGINAVLAYAGAVTCSQSFILPIHQLITYMRIKDSLNESTSTFKAELDRMKYILETVEQDKKSFFLIDEMLRGTNSVDKYLGSRAIIKKLIAYEAKGMVATHDLQLATLAEEYPGKVQNYHFDIQVKEGEMLFDYKLKDGKCTVFNASMLLKGIGVDVES